MRFSASRINTWSSCALQARFKYIDGLPTKTGSKATFGKCIHAALEHYNRTTDVDMAVKLFLELWDNPQEQIDVWNKNNTYGGLRQKGIEILREYHDKLKWESRQVLFQEHEFLVPLGRHELYGFVDVGAVRANHRGKQMLCVEDYKTAAKAPLLSELLMNLQFTIYIYASMQPEFWFGNGDCPAVPNAEWWYEMLKDTPRRGIWVHLWGGCKDLDAGGREEVDFQRLYRVCNEIERAIEHEVFVPTISGSSCGVCDYANGPCPVEMPTRDEWKAIQLDAEASWL